MLVSASAKRLVSSMKVADEGPSGEQKNQAAKHTLTSELLRLVVRMKENLQ